MGYTIIAPFEQDAKALLLGLKEFSIGRVILLVPKGRMQDARKAARMVEGHAVTVEIKDMGSDLVDDMFRLFSTILSRKDPDLFLVNIAAGSLSSASAALSAAFAHGLRAFGKEGKELVMYPVLNLSYYEELSDTKMRILRVLSRHAWLPLQEIAKRLGLSISLLSYHLNGNTSYKGLEAYRL
ncbi:hypothetical protein COY28_01910, partial [Candidatus Woesearchaeota archaeon CG_4_10_14_0_2_um_filter_57_5]